ncbi:hypothetical protein GCM10023340_13490 [Nocardioides marinquilinus]|uniref:Uncharacterized protein n=1 Tax=Nocardioides marinquilinus TaxID=1210400 RepID=A0ABP9PDS9_9ACTN
MELHHHLHALGQQAGRDVFDDAEGFRGVLDDFLDEGDATTGDINLLVDAVRLGAFSSLITMLDSGADAGAAVEEVGARLARDRGSADVAGGQWALAVLGFAVDRVGEGEVRRFRTQHAPSTGATPAASAPQPPAAPPAPTQLPPPTPGPGSPGQDDAWGQAPASWPSASQSPHQPQAQPPHQPQPYQPQPAYHAPPPGPTGPHQPYGPAHGSSGGSGAGGKKGLLIGGGALLLVAAIAVVLVLVLGGGDDDTERASDDGTPSETVATSETPTTSDSPTDPATDETSVPPTDEPPTDEAPTDQPQVDGSVSAADATAFYQALQTFSDDFSAGTTTLTEASSLRQGQNGNQQMRKAVYDLDSAVRQLDLSAVQPETNEFLDQSAAMIEGLDQSYGSAGSVVQLQLDVGKLPTTEYTTAFTDLSTAISNNTEF